MYRVSIDLIRVNRAVRRYQVTQSDDANQRRALLGRYERAIDFVRAAETALAAGRQAEATDRIGRAQAAVGELAGALDRADGGEVPQNLARLYEFSSRRLREAAASREVRPLAEVAVLLEGLLDAWRQAHDRFKPTNKHQNNGECSP